MDPRLIEAMSQMTPDKAKEMLEQMSPEERQQVEQVQKGMADLQHLAVALKPDSADPDAPVSNLTIVKVLSGAPMLCERMQQGWDKFGETVDDAVLDRLEKALVEMGALEEGALSECAARKNALLLYWHMNRTANEELAATFPPELDAMRSGMNQLATQLLVKAQMLMPQQRWVQQTLAVARVSALVANGLASHTDPAALAAMAKILEDPETGGPLPMPKLSVSARARPRNATEESEESEVTAGQQVLVTITVTREHAASPGDAAPQATNPQGIYEAYCEPSRARARAGALRAEAEGLREAARVANASLARARARARAWVRACSGALCASPSASASPPGVWARAVGCRTWAWPECAACWTPHAGRRALTCVVCACVRVWACTRVPGVYLEGLKPEGTTNSLITAQPMPVKELSQRTISTEIPFQSPPAPGTYHLKVHVLSTSVIGVELSAPCEFTVVEDDVPDLE